MKDFEVSNGRISAGVSADGKALFVRNSTREYRTGDDWSAIVYGDCIPLDLPRNGDVEVRKCGEQLIVRISRIVWRARFPGNGFCKPSPAPEMSFEFRIRLEDDEAVFTAVVPEGLDDESLKMRFPEGLLNWDTAEHCRLISTFRTLGMCYNYPSDEKFYNDVGEFMPLAGLFDDDGGIGICSSGIWDHMLYAHSNVIGSSGRCGFKHEFVRGKSEYDREVRVKIFAAGSGHVELAKWYRSVVIREGRFVSLKEKIAANPEVGKLAGSVLWKHNVYYQQQLPPGVEKDWSLYVFSEARSMPEGKVGNWSAKEVFDTAGARGFDRLCILNTGWNRYGYDSAYPTRLPVNPSRGTAEDFKRAAAYGRGISPDYICSVHDNYRDIYPTSPEFDRSDLIFTGDGIPLKGGIWQGGRCYIGCTQATWKYAQRDLPEIAELAGRGAIYLDVFGQTLLENCFNPLHPANKREDAAGRTRILQLAKKYFGAVVTEGAPCEWAVPVADVGAYVQFRNRGMRSDSVPIPLFQLVYHDSIFNYAGCDHCGLAGTMYSNRVALYCMLPYGFDEASLRISKELRESFVEEMVDHRYLSENVERTTFANGVTVTINNGNIPEFDVKPGDFRIDK